MKDKTQLRFVVIELKHRKGAFCVDDLFTDTTKAVFYDEAAKELAEDFCRQMNKAAGLK
jgi:hypothetical protein